MFTLIEVDKIKQIADHYKLEHQLKKTLEELSELSQEIRDYLFDYQMKLDDITTCRIVDEIADVKIMLEQLEYLLLLKKEIEERIKFKLDRQISRMTEERSVILD